MPSRRHPAAPDGRAQAGGSECYCKESSFLGAVLAALLLDERDAVVLDMGAGIEGLTRGTARGVDLLLVVTEPSQASVRTALVITGLGADLGIACIGIVANKIRNAREEEYVRASIPHTQWLGQVGYDPEVLDRALAGEDAPAVSPTGRLYADLEDVGKRVIERLGIQEAMSCPRR